MKTIVIRAVSCIALGLALSACETDVVDDAGFQLWCGETLCVWTLEEGEIDKVSTWHDHDYGVELVGAPVLLSQDARASAQCVRLETVSDVDASAVVTVEIDTDGDGESDHVVPVPPTDGYESRSVEVVLDLPPKPDTVYYVRKSGEGRAVLARLRISRECGR